MIRSTRRVVHRHKINVVVRQPHSAFEVLTSLFAAQPQAPALVQAGACGWVVNGNAPNTHCDSTGDHWVEWLQFRQKD
jgi:hypothetical protein